MPARSFAFVVERLPAEPVDFADRIYAPLDDNRALVQRNGLLYQAAFETARSYYYHQAYLERTRWAQALQAQLAAQWT